MQNKTTHIHVIGICGVATSALAIAFHNKGYKVTGSDKGFFPPVSTALTKAKVPYYAGWHPEKMCAEGDPDIVVVGTASGTANPETAYAREHNIKIYSFAEAIGAFFVKDHSIVCSGTWGKTSSSTLLSYILEKADFDPTYMFGGISLSHAASAKLGSSSWSVFEGDEYKSSPTDNTPKFLYYKPTHLLLSAVSWDHADLYPTEDSYFEVFKRLVSNIPQKGIVVACNDHEGVHRVVGNYSGHKILYGKSGDYVYANVKESRDGLKFTITRNGELYQIDSPMIGAFQAENITGCFAMAHQLGIAPSIIIEAIASFKGLRRRLEKRLDGAIAPAGITVFDDIAHSPEKASSILKTLRKIYGHKIIAIFEPNIGGRRVEAKMKYQNAFKDADTVIIPRLTKLKIAENSNEQPLEGNELATLIGETHADTRYIEEDEKLIETLTTTAKNGDVIAFLGSHGFRGMIEEIVKKL